MHRARGIAASAAIALGAGLLTGCGGGGNTATPPPWSADPGQQGLIAGSTPTGSPGRKTTGDGTWSFTLAKDSTNPNVPTEQWPDAADVLTEAQLKAAVPEATAVTKKSCVKGTSGPSGSTAKNASCTWDLTLPGGSAAYPSSITVDLVAVAADQRITTDWQNARNASFSSRKADERFFEQGAFGAKGAYYLDNGNASVLVSDGNIAAWINLRFVGFTSLPDWRSAVNTGIFPVLAADLADRLPRKYA
ncbi:hypothetical protein HJ588_13375 [Flexivirga sp. ID2601S]|uniref:Uncharacterized protein n=1 Tax=Flexivirga aerilata TaxID=1656889 RepID=A0A849ALS4_9MICO|nr:hypothetical protein [Flexivirga aerilata]NNG40258.1 hypothetical protein [Flexivirga aerilata]